MQVEIMPELLEQALEVLRLNHKELLGKIVSFFVEVLTTEFDLSESQADYLRGLLGECELRVSDSLCNGAICAEIASNPASWSYTIMNGKMDYDDMRYRMDQLQDDKRMRVVLIKPGQFYLDLRDTEKPQAATFAEALAKADDCRAHGREIELAITGQCLEQELIELLEAAFGNVITGPYQKTLENIRAVVTSLRSEDPWVELPDGTICRASKAGDGPFVLA